MTVATYITLVRILLVPVFVGALVYYDHSSGMYELKEVYRLVALWAFVIASVCDALDGYVARRFNQKSHLGAILDPLADKLLILSAVITLSIIQVPEFYQLPLWFPIVIVSRDVILVIGFAILHNVVRNYKIEPHWSGKISTVLQMAIIIMVLLRIDGFFVGPVTYVTGAFILWSLVVYIIRFVKFIQDSGQA